MLTQARRELERKLAQTKRLASLVGDPTTSQRLMELREDSQRPSGNFRTAVKTSVKTKFAPVLTTFGNSTATLTAATKNFGFGLKGSL